MRYQPTSAKTLQRKFAEKRLAEQDAAEKCLRRLEIGVIAVALAYAIYWTVF